MIIEVNKRDEVTGKKNVYSINSASIQRNESCDGNIMSIMNCGNTP